jgi:transcriptional regulator with XRE-family HTH domain
MMKNLKRLRTERNLSQMDLALDLGLPQSTYQQYEAGIHEAGYDTLIQIADYFDVSIDFLLGRTNIRTSVNDDSLRIAMRIQDLSDPEFSKAALIMLEQIEKMRKP